MQTLAVRGTTRQKVSDADADLDFPGLFQFYYSRIYNYLRYRVDAQEDAEDLSNTVFERAYVHRGGFDAAKGSFSTWLFRIAHNTLANYYRTRERRMAREVEGDLPTDLVTSEPSPEALVIQDEAIAHLLRSLQHLSERDQEVISLKFAGQLSNLEIGQIMGLKEKTVSVVLLRAVRRLQQHLKGDAT